MVLFSSSETNSNFPENVHLEPSSAPKLGPHFTQLSMPCPNAAALTFNAVPNGHLMHLFV